MRRAAEIEIDMHWNNGWHSGGGWLAMVAVMVVFWGGIAWVVMRLIRSGRGNGSISNVTNETCSPLFGRLERGPKVIDIGGELREFGARRHWRALIELTAARRLVDNLESVSAQIIAQHLTD